MNRKIQFAEWYGPWSISPPKWWSISPKNNVTKNFEFLQTESGQVLYILFGYTQRDLYLQIMCGRYV